ncbi:MAG: glycosyltransferase, partial [Clostridium perfringens]|nr:glycosyltransferase [Clostridium perfringens]
FNIAKRMKQIVDKGKPIIGYYGALAKWFDYEKIKKLAEKRPDYEIVLIGINYDRSYDRSGLDKLPNVSYLGIINYIDLITYSAFFDICMVPFIKNDITDSTSPVKIFEYMALEKPIVTTDINECKSYESCQIAYSDDDFIEKVDYAIKVLTHDEEYKRILKKEAGDNTWKHRAKQIKAAIKNFN